MNRAADPRRWMRAIRRIGLLVGAALLWWGMRDFRFATISTEDDSTPTIRPGARALVRTLTDDAGALERDELYLFDPTGHAERIDELRLARLVGLPGDRVTTTPIDAIAGARAEWALVRFGPLERRLPTELAELLPSEIPAGCVFVLTDDPAARHPDSRALGPLPVERLKLRVLASLGGLPR